jgi:hypothetical protein
VGVGDDCVAYALFVGRSVVNGGRKNEGTWCVLTWRSLMIRKI